MERDFLGEFEITVLLAVLRLGEGAYAVPVREEIEKRTGRKTSRGAIYITLDRLEKKGYLDSWLADPTPERGGRAKRYYRVNQTGMAALEDSWIALQRMWQGLEPVIGGCSRLNPADRGRAAGQKFFTFAGGQPQFQS